MLPLGEPPGALLDDERGHALAARLGVGLGIDDQRVRVGAVGDPVLGTVEDIIAVPLVRPQLHADDVGPRPFLGHGQRADMLAGTQLRQVSPLLLVRAVQFQLVDAQVGMGPVGQADAGRGAGDFLDGDGVGQITHPRSAVFLGDGDAQQAQLAHLAPQGGGKLVRSVNLRRDRLDPVLSPAVHGLAQRVHILAQVEFHASGEHPPNPSPVIERSFS